MISVLKNIEGMKINGEREGKEKESVQKSVNKSKVFRKRMEK